MNVLTATQTYTSLTVFTSSSSFKILNKGNNRLDLMIKEALVHITEENPDMNAQATHLALSLAI